MILFREIWLNVIFLEDLILRFMLGEKGKRVVIEKGFLSKG